LSCFKKKDSYFFFLSLSNIFSLKNEGERENVRFFLKLLLLPDVIVNLEVSNLGTKKGKRHIKYQDK